MASFRSDGQRIDYDDIAPAQGEIGTVVLVHGFATNRQENWRRLGWYGAFERKGYRTIALDLRGHGTSDKPHDSAAYGRVAMVGDIIALIDHLDLRRVELMGYSLGAHLALHAALTHPERIANLILGGVGARMLAPPPADPALMTMGEAMRIGDPELIAEPTLKGFRRFADQQGEDRLALAACSEGEGLALDRSRLGGIAAPALIIAGSRDEIAGDPEGLAQVIPGARAVSLPACDHFSAIPHGLFKAAVFDFLEGWTD
ncbi:MAG TPA: alpha/beta hydrolase [Caulobacteraceae bacterium]